VQLRHLLHHIGTFRDIDVPRVHNARPAGRRLGEPSAQARVEAAREMQRRRFAPSANGAANGGPPIACNADMRPAEVRVHCSLDDADTALMRAAMSQLQLSAQAFGRVLKLARTIADPAGSERIMPAHLAETIQKWLRQQQWRGLTLSFDKIWAFQ
jgi:magnesium chelatase family protein